MNQKNITEICVHEHKKIEGPTKALVAVVSLAVTLVTMGTGAELGAFAISGMGKGVAATTICLDFSSNLPQILLNSAIKSVNNKGLM